MQKLTRGGVGSRHSKRGKRSKKRSKQVGVDASSQTCKQDKVVVTAFVGTCSK